MAVPSSREFRALLSSHGWTDLPALPGRKNDILAGVLVPLCLDEGDWVTWMTLRPNSLSLHGGEVCFPGGRPEPADDDLWDTATREAGEELGLSVKARLGRLSSMPLYTSDFRLVPYVAEVEPGVFPQPAEVERVLRVAILDWLDAPHIDALVFDWQGQELYSPVFPIEGLLTFGGTAHVFLELLHALAPAFGREVPPFQAGGYAWVDGAVRAVGETA